MSSESALSGTPGLPPEDSAERYRSIVAAMAEGVVFQDATGQIIFCNPAAERILGMPAEGMIGRTSHDAAWQAIREDGEAFPGADHPALVTLRTGRPCTGVLMGLRKPDESVTWISISSEPLLRRNETTPYAVVTTFEDVTRQLIAEQRLKRSEELFRTMVENQGEGAGIVDLDERFLFANPAGHEIFGVAQGGLIGRSLLEFVSPQHASLVRSETQARIAGRRSEYELEIIRESDRTARIVLVSATPQIDGRGRVSATFGVFRDITDRKRVELALQESEERLRLAAEANQMGTFDIYPLSGKRVWSPVTKRLFGFSLEEDVPYEMFIGAVHPDDRPRVHVEVQAMLTPQHRDKFTSEFRIIRSADGEPRWISSWSRPFFDEHGRAVRLIGIAQDITDRKRAEEALRESEARLKLTFDQAPVGAVMVGLDRRFMRVNAAFCRFLGYEPEELIGRSMPDVSHPDTRATDSEHARLLEEGKLDLYRTDKRYLRKDGSVVWGHVTVRLLKDASGRGLYFVSMVEDITDRMKAEEEQERLQAQLAQAQKMESIGRLAGGVAHDFNNLLTVINGYSSMALARLREDDPMCEIVREIHNAGASAAALVRQLLAFGRRQMLRQEALDLNAMVREMEKTLLPLVGEHIEITTACAPCLEAVLADRYQIEQVILNLAVNARDAMPQGGRLTIETAAETKGPSCPRCTTPLRTGRYIRLTVRDTGTGMDASTREHLFEPFFSTKEAGEGTGLGLATVHGIVLQSGGHIDVESEPEKGTAFHVYLPAAEGQAPEPKVAETAGDAGRSTPGSETILLVEDQTEVRNYSAEVLREYGYRVLTASSGREALAHCESQRIDVLLTDVVMPKMSGYELSLRVRARQPQVKVLFMSGYSEEMLAGHADGIAGIMSIQKPFTAGTLAGKVREVLTTRTS